jgi:putative membrane protein
MIFGPLAMILVIAAVIALVVVLVRWLSGSSSYQRPHARTPLDILKERFARGEIDKDEYEERRRTLSEGAD